MTMTPAELLAEIERLEEAAKVCIRIAGYSSKVGQYGEVATLGSAATAIRALQQKDTAHE